MRWIITIAILIIPSVSLAQGLKVGLSIGPTSRDLHHKNRTEFKKPWANNNSKEYALLGWDTGLSIEKPLGRWAVASGVYYSFKGFQHGPVYSTYPRTNERNATTYVNYHFEFIEVPLLVKYNFTPFANFNLYGMIGASAAWLIGDYRTLDVRWGELTQPQADALVMEWDGQNYFYRHFNIGAWLGIGIAKPLNKRFEVSIAPLFKCFVKYVNYIDAERKFFKGLPDRRYLYSFGLDIGISYKFGKREDFLILF